MDRTLKAPAGIKPRPGDAIALFPGASEAEPWEAWLLRHDESRLLQACSSPRENPWQKRSTFVLPAAQVFCLPLWLNETQEDRLVGMIDLQLESRGLAGRTAAPTIYQWSTVARDDKRTLVLVGLLPARLPEDFRVASYQAFDVSPRYFAWPENAMVLWMEQGKLAVAFTRGAHLVYFQDLGEEQCTERVLQTAVCLRASLEFQNILPGLAQVVLWTELGGAERDALEAQFGLPVRPAERPAPVSPAQPWNLCPPEVARSKREVHTRRWKGRGLIALAVVYLIATLLFVARYFLLSHQANELQRQQTAQAPALASIQQSRQVWNQLQPVVDTANYPLEILLHCTTALPKDQLHLTLFEMEDGNVHLKGEATNVAAAYQLLDHLKADKELSDYDWKMDEPHLESNDLAQLQIEGTHASTHP
jgi:hypothetical protein